MLNNEHVPIGVGLGTQKTQASSGGIKASCPEYRQLLGEYQRALQIWATFKKADKAIARNLGTLEETHQHLKDHQQSCRICCEELGYGDHASGQK